MGMGALSVPIQEIHMLQYLLGLNHSPFTLKPNKLLIPVTALYPSDETIDRFNALYEWVRKNVKYKIRRTKSGGISISRLNFKPPMWDIQTTNSCVELTLVLIQGLWRIQMRFGSAPLKETDISGRQAFEKFKEILKKHNINLKDYEISNGEEVKKEIEKTMIYLERRDISNLTWTNVNHIDIHSAWPAGLVALHPEFKESIEELYLKRKTDPLCKAVLNMSIGYFQSISCCQARWAHLSRDAINYNNKVMRDLAARLKAAGRRILCYNTDGIWYQGDIYHGEGEGSGLGQWSNDHINCKWRAKSAGRYEYIEDGEYHPVVRGRTKLDKVKPRELWQWGDVMSEEAQAIEYIFVENIGIRRLEDYDII